MTIEEVLHDRAHAEPGISDGIAGRWTNALGSGMELGCDGEGGELCGTYTSGVRDRHTYHLTGFDTFTRAA